MRAFIAVELPEGVRQALGQMQRELAVARADVKWVEQENLHVTMRFLGEITEEQRQAVERLLTRIAAHTPPIQVRLSELGAFPSVASPRIIWVGIEMGHEVLAAIASELAEGLVSLEIPPEERPFTAHVTLGRVRSPKNQGQLTTQLRELNWKSPQPFCAEGLTLFQSTLSASGPIYTALATCAFGGR